MQAARKQCAEMVDALLLRPGLRILVSFLSHRLHQRLVPGKLSSSQGVGGTVDSVRQPLAPEKHHVADIDLKRPSYMLRLLVGRPAVPGHDLEDFFLGLRVGRVPPENGQGHDGVIMWTQRLDSLDA